MRYKVWVTIGSIRFRVTWRGARPFSLNYKEARGFDIFGSIFAFCKGYHFSSYYVLGIWTTYMLRTTQSFSVLLGCFPIFRLSKDRYQLFIKLVFSIAYLRSRHSSHKYFEIICQNQSTKTYPFWICGLHWKHHSLDSWILRGSQIDIDIQIKKLSNVCTAQPVEMFENVFIFYIAAINHA